MPALRTVAIAASAACIVGGLVLRFRTGLSYWAACSSHPVVDDVAFGLLALGTFGLAWLTVTEQNLVRWTAAAFVPMTVLMLCFGLLFDEASVPERAEHLARLVFWGLFAPVFLPPSMLAVRMGLVRGNGGLLILGVLLLAFAAFVWVGELRTPVGCTIDRQGT